MMKALVTGGAGFIGSHLVEALLRAGLQVTVVDDLSSGRRSQVPAAAKLVKLDVRSPKLRELVGRLQPAYVCHLAAQVSVGRSQADAMSDAEINIVGGLNLVEALRGCDITKFLFVSSSGVYGAARQMPTPEDSPAAPASPYALAKRTMEEYLNHFSQARGLPVVVVRPANVYGPRQDSGGEGGVVAVFCRQILQGEHLTIHGQGAQTRDFVYVTDVAAGMAAALTKGNGVYNLGTSAEISVRELAVKVGEVAGQVPKVSYAPLRQGDILRSSLSCISARRDLGWQPQVPLEDGLRQTLRWFKEHAL